MGAMAGQRNGVMNTAMLAVGVTIAIAALSVAMTWGRVVDKIEVHEKAIDEMRADYKATQRDISKIRVAIEGLKRDTRPGG